MKKWEMKQIAYQSSLKNRALQVLVYLIDRINTELTCFPAIRTIGRELHISISTVKRSLRELVKEGFVEKKCRYREKNGGQTSNLYTLSFEENGKTGSKTEENRKSAVPEPVCSRPMEGDINNAEKADNFTNRKNGAPRQDTDNEKQSRFSGFRRRVFGICKKISILRKIMTRGGGHSELPDRFRLKINSGKKILAGRKPGNVDLKQAFLLAFKDK